MDIEAIVKKHLDANWYGEDSTGYDDVAEAMRDALTELAAEYKKQITELQAMAINNGQQAVLLGDRVTQLEAELGGYLTVGGGHIVYGTAEALARVQAYILLDSKHPREERDTNRYFAKQLQAAEQHIKQLEAERVPDGWKLVPKQITTEMADAYWLAYDEISEGSHLGVCYAAMLDAVPAKEGE